MALMRRRVFQVFSVLSGLLSVALMVLWVRSYFVGDVATYYQRPGDGSSAGYGVSSGCGSLGLSSFHFSGFPVRALGWYRVDAQTPYDRAVPPVFLSSVIPVSSRISWNYLGFACYSGSNSLHFASPDHAPWITDLFLLAIPHWLPALLLAMPPFVHFRRAWRVRYRRAHNLCLSCGYDLRAHAAGQKCPECGTVILTDTFHRPLP